MCHHLLILVVLSEAEGVVPFYVGGVNFRHLSPVSTDEVAAHKFLPLRCTGVALSIGGALQSCECISKV